MIIEWINIINIIQLQHFISKIYVADNKEKCIKNQNLSVLLNHLVKDQY